MMFAQVFSLNFNLGVDRPSLGNGEGNSWPIIGEIVLRSAGFLVLVESHLKSLLDGSSFLSAQSRD